MDFFKRTKVSLYYFINRFKVGRKLNLKLFFKNKQKQRFKFEARNNLAKKKKSLVPTKRYNVETV